MSELHLEGFTREALISYLLAHIYPSVCRSYEAAAAGALARQSTETLRAMAISTYKEQIEREEKRRQARQKREPHGKQHTR